jgi:ankyrin repeat protein
MTQSIADNQNLRGDSCLHVAARSGHFRNVQLLLDYGFLPNVRNNALDTPLHEATRIGANMVAVLLINNGGRVTARNDRAESVLHTAVSSGNIEVVRTVIKHARQTLSQENFSLFINLTNKDGNTALHRAFSSHAPDPIVTELLSNGADINKRNIYSHTPLCLAPSRPLDEIVAALRVIGRG